MGKLTARLLRKRSGGRSWETEGTTEHELKQRPGKRAGILALVLGLLVKGKGLLLFLLKALKLDILLQVFKLGSLGGTLITMALMARAYAGANSWAFAAGFVLLLFLHEMGHYLTARQYGVEVSAPVFIPFMGAFISLKGKPENAEVEGKIAIAGPLAGTLGTGLTAAAWLLTGQEVFQGLVYVNILITLFNLIPFGFLDGGRVASALSGRLWPVGLVLFGALALATRNPLLLLLLITGTLGALKGRKTDREADPYYDVDAGSLGLLAVAYFGVLLANGAALTAFLVLEKGWSLL